MIVKELLSWKNYALCLRSASLLRTDDIAREFSGKDIAIVGNSCALAEKQLGDRIDECDIVVRFNNCPMVGKPSHGCMTDWIALSTQIPRKIYMNLNARGILWLSPRRRKMPGWLVLEQNLYLNPRSMARQIIRSARDRPSTGLMMIHLLSTFDTGKVKLFGFDFFKSCSLSGNHTRETTPHDFFSEELFVHQLMQQDERFELCDEQLS